MSNTYTDKNLEEFIQKHFAVKLNFEEVVARNLPVSYSTEVLIFRSKNQKLYAFISGEARLTLGDISKSLAKMNLKPAKFFPPNGLEDYFLEHARAQFLRIFPAREHISNEELRFYKTQVIYNPALVEIASIRNGEIKCCNTDAIGSWRVAKRLNYRSIL